MKTRASLAERVVGSSELRRDPTAGRRLFLRCDVDAPGLPEDQHPEYNHRDPDAPLTVSLPQHDQHSRFKVFRLRVVARS
jgi:hypothetical protein